MNPLEAVRARVLDPADAVVRYGAGVGRGGELVFTNGCFDLLHPGHLHLLAAARSEGAVLLVGLNSDASVRRLKGAGRPVRSEFERALHLASLRWVDAVTVFDEETPLGLIQRLRPDVLVKGADYGLDEIVGATEVLNAGGRVVLVPLLHGHSSTAELDRLGRKPEAPG